MSVGSNREDAASVVALSLHFSDTTLHCNCLSQLGLLASKLVGKASAKLDEPHKSVQFNCLGNQVATSGTRISSTSTASWMSTNGRAARITSPMPAPKG